MEQIFNFLSFGQFHSFTTKLAVYSCERVQFIHITSFDITQFLEYFSPSETQFDIIHVFIFKKLSYNGSYNYTIKYNVDYKLSN